MLFEIPEDIARACFDIAVNSLDFASGFLSSEEVEQLRAYAEILGVDPMEATPHEHKPKYCPGHQYESYQGWYSGRPDQTIKRCIICDHHIYPSHV